MAQQAARLRDARVELALTPLREGYRIDPADPILLALRDAYEQVSGRPLPVGTGAYSTCAGLFQRRAGVTAIAHGVDTATFRSDQEEVSIDELVRVARTYLCLTLRYLDHTAVAMSTSPEMRQRVPAPAAAAVSGVFDHSRRSDDLVARYEGAR
jgi:acetylornithine deacetylase/succinyl-diaminopimelate desuccinylase-like protein